MFEEDAAPTKKRARVVTPPATALRTPPPPPKKRKASSDLRSSPETSAFERPSKAARHSDNHQAPSQNLASHFPASLFPFPGLTLTRPLTSFPAPPPPPPEFMYSDLMKRMAAKYQQPEERYVYRNWPPRPFPQPSLME